MCEGVGVYVRACMCVCVCACPCTCACMCVFNSCVCNEQIICHYLFNNKEHSFLLSAAG